MTIGSLLAANGRIYTGGQFRSFAELLRRSALRIFPTSPRGNDHAMCHAMHIWD